MSSLSSYAYGSSYPAGWARVGRRLAQGRGRRPVLGLGLVVRIDFGGGGRLGLVRRLGVGHGLGVGRGLQDDGLWIVGADRGGIIVRVVFRVVVSLVLGQGSVERGSGLLGRRNHRCVRLVGFAQADDGLAVCWRVGRILRGHR